MDKSDQIVAGQALPDEVKELADWVLTDKQLDALAFAGRPDR